MTKLNIRKWTGETRDVQFVGYNRNRTVCFIRDEQNARRAIALHLPRFFEVHFYQHPIGKDGSAPVEIKRTALHLPACFANENEKQAFDDPQSNEVQCARTFSLDVWKAITVHKCWLEPRDDGPLAKLLHDELNRLRRLHAIREKETADLIAVLPPGETKRASELRDMLRGEFTTFGKGVDGRSKIISSFDASLDMVRDGWAGLRERFLEQQWAEHFGIDVKMIPVEAASFHAWLQKHAYNARQRTTDLQTRTVELGHCLNLYPSHWEVLEAAALYEVRFADGTRCWLDDIEERAITSPEEIEDFEKLESAQKPPEIQNPTPTKWHSEDFREIYFHDRVGRLKDIALPHNSLRALCLLLAGHVGKPMPFTEIEPKIGALACELDKTDKVKKPSNVGSHQIRDLVNRTTTGKKLKRWCVLTLNGSRERFIKLAPPVVK